MSRTTMKSRAKVLLLCLVAVGLVAGCSSGGNKIGTLVGVQVSSNLDDLSSGDFVATGIVTVELDDGTQVAAIWPSSLGDTLTGGMTLEIARSDDPDYWTVVRIVETPEVETPE